MHLMHKFGKWSDPFKRAGYPHYTSQERYCLMCGYRDVRDSGIARLLPVTEPTKPPVGPSGTSSLPQIKSDPNIISHFKEKPSA